MFEIEKPNKTGVIIFSVIVFFFLGLIFAENLFTLIILILALLIFVLGMIYGLWQFCMGLGKKDNFHGPF